MSGLCVGHFHQMVDALNHTTYRGGVLLYHCVVHLLETESIQSALLHCGRADTALDLLYFNLCHLSESDFYERLLAIEYLAYRNTAVLGDLGG